MYMNIYESDILKLLSRTDSVNQRTIAEKSGHSLGVVNKALNSLIENKYVGKGNKLTTKGRKFLMDNKPARAVILAAGYGMRMVPINTETPKAFIKVHGECLIERQIKQLHQAGITEIYVVVGFLKEQFEYLIDEYNVKLIVNTEYAVKGNLHSLKLAQDYLENSYIIPSDIWCDYNPFDQYELYSLYMVSNLIDDESDVRVNRKSELVRVGKDMSGNAMIGITYLNRRDAAVVRTRLNEYAAKDEYNSSFWEETLYNGDRMFISSKVASSTDVVEVNSYEQLRELDSESDQLKTYVISVIKDVFNVDTSEIKDITILKKGMTNRSFMFTCKGNKYIMKVPETEIESPIDRKNEAATYEALKSFDFSENVIYINPENGYKISEYIEPVKKTDLTSEKDILKCINLLKKLHKAEIKTDYQFDFYKFIEFYEGLWKNGKSVYRDYEKTKAGVYSLKEYIDEHACSKVLSHIDTAADNFIFSADSDGNEQVHLIDWEFAGMLDPYADIALFCIYALYDKDQIDHVIDIYTDNMCDEETRIKIYCYIATGGLIWSNWCEYMRSTGVEFGEYSIKQYRYAKEYYRYAMEYIEGKNNKDV